MNNALGIVVRGLRKQKHLTLKGLSEMTGVSYAQIGKIERGVHTPKRKTIEKIADALSYDRSKLLKLAGYYPVVADKEETGISLTDRFKVIIKYNGTCQICGAQAPNTPIEVTYANPLMIEEDPAHFDNLITLCSECLTARDLILKEG